VESFFSLVSGDVLVLVVAIVIALILFVIVIYYCLKCCSQTKQDGYLRSNSNQGAQGTPSISSQRNSPKNGSGGKRHDPGRGK